MKNTKTDRTVYLEAKSIAIYSSGGWGYIFKTMKVRKSHFKKQFCGNILRPKINWFNYN